MSNSVEHSFEQTILITDTKVQVYQCSVCYKKTTNKKDPTKCEKNKYHTSKRTNDQFAFNNIYQSRYKKQS